MKIPFDIKYRPQIESGEYKVETTDGNPVRIVCWNRNCSIPIVGLVGKFELPYVYTTDGKYASGWDNGVNDLLIITPEPELTSWQTFISGCLQKHGLLDCGAADRIAKKCSAELLELAKDEIYSHESLVEYAKKAKEEGKAEALKDLPRWKRADRDIFSNTIEFAVPYTHDGGDHDDWLEVIVTNSVHKGEKYLEISDLEKLTGFNE